MVELENRLLCPLDDEVLFQDGEFEGDAFEAEAEQFVPFVVPVRAKRAVKMEIQVLHNRVFRVSRSGKRRLLGRKFGPPSTQFLHKGKKGRPAGKGKEGTAIELQSEAGGFLEFETPKWFTSWCALRKRIEEAVEIVRDIQQPANLLRTEGSSRIYRFPYDTKHLEKKKHFRNGLRKGETLEVEIKDPSFKAKIQFSEKFALPQYHDYLEQHLGSGVASRIQSQAHSIVGKVNTNKLPGSTLTGLVNFLEIVLTYLWSIERTNKRREQRMKANPNVRQKVPLAKEHIHLMSRTNLSSIFRTLLSEDEKKLFSAIVKKHVLLKELGMDRKTPVFRLGYKGRLPRRSGLTKKDEISVHYWLRSIEKRQRDLLARIGGDNRAMGRFDVPDSSSKDRFLVRFETRGGARKADSIERLVQPMSRWVAFAQQTFKISHQRRSSSLLSLTYNPEKCP